MCGGGGGADQRPGAQTRDTPLMVAARLGKAKVVQALLASGADPEVVNATGESPKTLAKKRKSGIIMKLIADPADAGSVVFGASVPKVQTAAPGADVPGPSV